MTADLAVYTSNESALAQLNRQSVIELLERGKTWIEMARERDAEVDDFVNFKGGAETVRVYTVQKQLGKDAELAAAELVRRAERGIGLAIRKGQEAGNIATKTEMRAYAGQVRQQIGNNDLLPERKPTPRDVAPGEPLTENGAGIYHLTDDVTDAQFDAAITEAKAEGNLSRANVVRKVTGREKPRGKRPEVLRRTHHIDSRRVIAATVETYLNNAIPKDLLAEVDFAELDTNDLREWISSLSESARALRSLRTTLEKELSQRG